jgi:hypothetical protein
MAATNGGSSFAADPLDVPEAGSVEAPVGLGFSSTGISVAGFVGVGVSSGFDNFGTKSGFAAATAG